MRIGKVTGSVVSTQKHDSLVGKKLMIVKCIDSHTEDTPELVAADSVGAGVGEYVLLTMGSVARVVFDDERTAVDCAIVGIIDSFEK